MAYVNLAQTSGMGQLPFKMSVLRMMTTTPSILPSIMPSLILKAKAETPPPPQPVIVARRPAVMPRYITPIRPAVLAPLVTMPLRPTLFKPAITTAIRLAKTQIIKAPLVTFRPNGIAPALTLQMRTPGGDVYKTTQVEVVPGADPVSAAITGAGAPTTGQSISLKESDPIVPLTATREGVTITDETEPAVPTFVEAAALEPSPYMKYGLLALGGYILYDTFVKSKPKKRRKRR